MKLLLAALPILFILTLAFAIPDAKKTSAPPSFNDTPRYEYFIKMNATQPELQRAGYIMDSIMKNYHGYILSKPEADQQYQIFINALSFLYTRMQKDSVLIKTKTK